jgi:hypothetical protein
MSIALGLHVLKIQTGEHFNTSVVVRISPNSDVARLPRKAKSGQSDHLVGN